MDKASEETESGNQRVGEESGVANSSVTSGVNQGSRLESHSDTEPIASAPVLIVELMCRYCSKMCFSNDEREVHEKTHLDNKKPIMCRLCGKWFSRRSYLREHMLIHSGASPWKCDKCPKVFTLRCSLVRHTRVHSGEKPFECKFCDRRFTLKTLMQAHLLTHTKEKPFCCTQCAKKFPRRNSLVRHARTHTGLCRFECAHCGNKFPWKYDLRLHLINKHEGPPTKTKLPPKKRMRRTKAQIARDKAAKEAEQRGNVEESLPSVPFVPGHQIKIKTSATSQAPESGNQSLQESAAANTTAERQSDAAEARTLTPPISASDGHEMNVEVRKLHQAVLETKKSDAKELRWLVPVIPRLDIKIVKSLEEQCEFCTKVYFSNNELQEHMNICHSDKKYMCNVCGKGFTRKSSLPQHMRIHEGVLPFKCPLCPKACRTQRNIESHMLSTHNSNKPFKCNKCSATFRRKGNMQRHQLKHNTKENLYECPVKCGLSVATKEVQGRHAKTHSNNKQKYVCAYCEKECFQKDDLREHISLKHANESPPESQLASNMTPQQHRLTNDGGSEETKPVKIEKEETIECSFQPFALKLEDTLRFGMEPVEVKKEETIKCTLEPVGVKKEQFTIEEYVELKTQLERERMLRTQVEQKIRRLETMMNPAITVTTTNTTASADRPVQEYLPTEQRNDVGEIPKPEFEPVVEVKKWDTIKCTLESVEMKEEKETIECKPGFDDIKMKVETEQSVKIKPEFMKEEGIVSSNNP